MNMTCRRSTGRLLAAGLAGLMVAGGAAAQSPPGAQRRPVADWVKKSNQHTRLMIEVLAELAPESASELGVEGYDDRISDLSPGYAERQLGTIRRVREELVRRLAAETDLRVKQDLEILIKAASDSARGIELRERLEIPDYNLDQLVFQSIRGLLDDQVAAARRPAALIRLRKYAGLEPGTKPIVELAIADLRQKLARPGLAAPVKAKLQKDLGQAPLFVEGIGKLFERFKIEGYQAAYAKLKEQLATWDAFVRAELLPRAREDFRMPPELYAFSLEMIGIDIPPAELAGRAHRAFAEIQGQMQQVAARVAREKHLPSRDYRDVIRALKKDQLVGDAILPHYKARLKEIEAIIRDHSLVRLPDRRAIIRLATEAESAAVPAPIMHPPG